MRNNFDKEILQIKKFFHPILKSFMKQMCLDPDLTTYSQVLETDFAKQTTLFINSFIYFYLSQRDCEILKDKFLNADYQNVLRLIILLALATQNNCTKNIFKDALIGKRNIYPLIGLEEVNGDTLVAIEKASNIIYSLSYYLASFLEYPLTSHKDLYELIYHYVVFTLISENTPVLTKKILFFNCQKFDTANYIEQTKIRVQHFKEWQLLTQKILPIKFNDLTYLINLQNKKYEK